MGFYLHLFKDEAVSLPEFVATDEKKAYFQPIRMQLGHHTYTIISHPYYISGES